MTIVFNNAQNGQTEPVASALGGQQVVVTTSGQTPPTVTLATTVALGSLTITADNGATADVNVVASVAGALSLNADGGAIDATSLVNAVSSVSVAIGDGGTFTAEGSFLALLSGASITFGSDVGQIDTLALNNNGSLLNLSATFPLIGFQTGGQDNVDDRLISGASVFSYAITQSAQGQPDILTYYNASNQSLGSLTFAAGTFNAGELGAYAVSAVGGPLQVTVGGTGGLLTTTEGNVLDGQGLSTTLAARAWVTVDNTANDWDTVTGSNGDVYVTNAQASILGGGDSAYFDKSSGDAVSLYNTSGSSDAVFGSNGIVCLTNASTSVTGQLDVIFAIGSGDAASLSGTLGGWDTFYGSNATISVSSAQTSVLGGADSISVYGAYADSVSLYNTNGAADTVTGSDATIILTQAQANVIGGGNIFYLDGSANDLMTLSNTAGVWDTVFGANATIDLSSAQASVIGGGDAVNFVGGSGNAVSLYNTGSSADSIVGSNGVIVLTNAQTNLTGSGDTVYFVAGSSSAINLSGTDLLWFNQSIGGQEVVTGAGAGDTYHFSKNDFANFAALSSHLTQSGGNAYISLSASDSVELVGVAASSLTASQFSFT